MPADVPFDAIDDLRSDGGVTIVAIHDIGVVGMQAGNRKIGVLSASRMIFGDLDNTGDDAAKMDSAFTPPLL